MVRFIKAAVCISLIAAAAALAACALCRLTRREKPTQYISLGGSGHL